MLSSNDSGRIGGPPQDFFQAMPPPVSDLVREWRSQGANELWILKSLLEGAEAFTHKPLHVPWFEWVKVAPDPAPWLETERLIRFRLGLLTLAQRDAWQNETPRAPCPPPAAVVEPAQPMPESITPNKPEIVTLDGMTPEEVMSVCINELAAQQPDGRISPKPLWELAKPWYVAKGGQRPTWNTLTDHLLVNHKALLRPPGNPRTKATR
jgi:hypothetical protein